MKKQEQAYFAEIQTDGVRVSDESGREIAFISRQETFEQNPDCPEEAWESLLGRVEVLYRIIA